jgi:hypothetical protein
VEVHPPRSTPPALQARRWRARPPLGCITGTENTSSNLRARALSNPLRAQPRRSCSGPAPPLTAYRTFYSRSGRDVGRERPTRLCSNRL